MYEINAVTREYYTETIDFVRSMVFKHSHTIDLQNTYLSQIGYPTPVDPREFKYYKNLAGEYHASDELVYVLSSDTGEEIPFTKEVLRDHPVTQIDYAPKGIFHRDLLEANPAHRHWIDRVLDPISFETAIEADDYQLLKYDPSFVASNEVSLIAKVQQWAYGYAQRWHQPDMSFHESLYDAAEIHIFTLSLVNAVIGIRYANVRSGEVDDYHMWAFLGSRYRLDRYKRHLNRTQALWLYRNIEYLRHHAGKEKTMEMLLEHIAKPSNIRADRFDITRTQENYLLQGKVTPTILINDYSVDRPAYAVENRETVNYAVGLTVDSARENEANLEDDISSVKKAVTMSSNSIVPTGQVRLRIGRPVTDVYFDERYAKIVQWFYLVEEGLMPRTHTLSLGSRGELVVSDREACLIFQYSMAAIMGNTIEQPFPMHFQTAHHSLGLTPNEIAEMLPPHLAKEKYDTKMSLGWVPHTMIRSKEEWNEYIDSMKYRWIQHYFLVHELHESDDRGSLRSVMERLYHPKEVQLSLGASSYSEWLDGIRFPRTVMKAEDYLDLMIEILDVVLDLILDGTGVSEKHVAVMEIIKLFAPYNMVFTDAGDLFQSIPQDYQAYQPYKPKGYKADETSAKVGFNGGPISNVSFNAVDSGKPLHSPTLSTVGHQDPALVNTLGYRAVQVAKGDLSIPIGLHGGPVEVTIIT